MSSQTDQRKKALRILLAVFLAFGGLVFVFSIYQGLGDLRDMEGKGTFSYGFSARKAALPLFQYFGLAEEAPTKYVRKCGTIDASGKLHPPEPDISGWMEKGGSPAASPASGGASGGSSSSPRPKTNIPKMAAASLGASPGGGGTRSSAAAPKPTAAPRSDDEADKQVSAMSRPGASKETRIAGSGKTSPAGGSLAAAGKSKTMGALASVRSTMIDGLKSHSAMTASAKWSQAFGSDTGADGGQSMAYASGSGLAALDSIKGGVGNLKLNDPGSLKTISPPSPTKDAESESKDDFLQAMQGMGGGKGGGGDEGKENAQEATAATQGQTDPRTGQPYGAVPEHVIDKAYQCVEDGGARCCPGQCKTSTGEGITDTKMRITPDGNGSYAVTAEGKTDSNATGTHVAMLDSTGEVSAKDSEVECTNENSDAPACRKDKN